MKQKKYTYNIVRLAKTAAAIALMLILAVPQVKAHNANCVRHCGLDPQSHSLNCVRHCGLDPQSHSSTSQIFNTNSEHTKKKFNFFHIKCNKTIFFSYIYNASSAVNKTMIVMSRHINQLCSRQLPVKEGRREAAKMQKTAVVAAVRSSD